LSAYCEQVGLKAITAPADVIVSIDTLVQPDIFVVPRDALGRPPASYDAMERPRLVIEVLSPATARVDRHRKLRLYRDLRINEYWIVDGAARRVERWRLTSDVVDVLVDSIVWQPVPEVMGLTINLIKLFQQVYGD
jgi:Uma2 family endonuclease